MRVVVAPDKFKGSLEAADVVEHLAAGLRAVDPSVEVVAVPVADGGEGTLDAADADDSGELNLSDAVWIFRYLFLGGDAPPDPGPATCGEDPTDDDLGCVTPGCPA